MKTDTNTLIDAMRILANEIESEDGVANAAIAEAADRLEQLQTQLSAAKRGMDSASAAGRLMMEKGRKLAAENSPEAIESEREANAVLTAENERLQAEVERLRLAHSHATIQLNEANEHKQQLRAALDQAEAEVRRARLDERQAMTYLSQVRIAAEHDGDFPSLVEHVKQMTEALRAAHEMAKAAWIEGSEAGW